MHEKSKVARRECGAGTAPTDDKELCEILTEAIWINGLLTRFLAFEKPLYELFSKSARFNELLVEFLTLAQDENGAEYAKQLASAALAGAYVSLCKHHRKLERVSPVYQALARRLGGIRADMLVPESPVGQILQEELRRAERYWSELVSLRELVEKQPPMHRVTVDEKAVERRLRDELVWQQLVAGSGALWRPKDLREIKRRAREGAADPGRMRRGEVTKACRVTWQDLAREQKIPEEYWPLAHLKALCQESEPAWWKFIWSRLRARQDELLPRLRVSGQGRAEAKTGHLYLKDFARQFRKHLKSLVDGMIGGIL